MVVAYLALVVASVVVVAYGSSSSVIVAGCRDGKIWFLVFVV